MPPVSLAFSTTSESLNLCSSADPHRLHHYHRNAVAASPSPQPMPPNPKPDKKAAAVYGRWGSKIRYFFSLKKLAKKCWCSLCVGVFCCFWWWQFWVRSSVRKVHPNFIHEHVNVDLCFTLSCELVGRLQNLKRWKLYTAHMPGRWRGGRWSEKCQLGRCTNQRWGAQARTHQKYVLAQWFVDITDFFPNTTVFYD